MANSVPDAAKAHDFSMGFVSVSDRYKSQFVDRWREVIANATVEPIWSDQNYQRSPYRYGRLYKAEKNQIILKDPETHQLVMTYTAKLMRVLFGDPKREYVQAVGTGWEDATKKVPAMTKLLRYYFSLPGVYRSFQEAITDMVMVGTAVVEIGYDYCEREMPVRRIESTMGIETDTETRMMVPIYNDVTVKPLDIMDFYPDPSRYRLEDMNGAAKRFRMNAFEARKMVARKLYDGAAVQQAIGGIGKQGAAFLPGDNFREGIDQPQDKPAPDEFKEMIGYEYWGEVPWEDKYGSSRRVITVLNDVCVRNAPYPYADPTLPFKSFVINPVNGRFYGIAPAEVVRYDQSFADAMKILLAEAVIRQVHPPIAYDPDADVDVAKLKAWRTDAMIAARGGPAAVGTIRYDANVQNGFFMLQGLKTGIQQASGALGAIQGENGPDREAASVGVQRYQMALDRPELAARLIEEDCLPTIGRSMIRRGQQFLDTDGLIERIGEMPEGTWIGDIMGDTFDVTFSGSRQVMSRQAKLQAIQTITALGASVPLIMAMFPLEKLAQKLVGDILDMPEAAALMPNAQQVAMQATLMQMMGGGGPADNGVGPAPQPPGMLPAQASGGEGGGG